MLCGRSPRCVRNVADVARRGEACAARIGRLGPACGRCAGRRGSHLHPADTLACQPDLLGRAMRQVKRAPAHEWSAVIDSHHHRPAGIGIRHPHVRAKRQSPRRSGESFRIVSLSRAGGTPREAGSVPRSDLGVRRSISHLARSVVAAGWQWRRAEILGGTSRQRKSKQRTQRERPPTHIRLIQMNRTRMNHLRVSTTQCSPNPDR